LTQLYINKFLEGEKMNLATNENKVCENCHFLRRPSGRSLNDRCTID